MSLGIAEGFAALGRQIVADYESRYCDADGWHITLRSTPTVGMRSRVWYEGSEHTGSWTGDSWTIDGVGTVAALDVPRWNYCWSVSG